MKKSAKIISLMLVVMVLTVCLTACSPVTFESMENELINNDFTVDTSKVTSAGGLKSITTAVHQIDKSIKVTIYAFDTEENANKFFPVIEKEKQDFDKNINDKIDKEKDEKKKEGLRKEKDSFVVKKSGCFILKGSPEGVKTALK